MACLTPEQIEKLAHGAIDPAEAEELFGHLELCETCRARFDECVANEETLRKLKQLPDSGSADEAGGVSTSARARRTAEGDLGRPSPDAFPGYEILREVSRGGQAVVYQAIRTASKQPVAIKVLMGGTFASRSARARFEREVELAASLQHPNIVAIHDSGVAEGRPYYVMEYIRGRPLTAHVADRDLPLSAIVQLFEKICAAVSCAHQHGIIHRDLKPGNILVDAEGEPHILDFGVAKVSGADDAEGGPLTVTGAFVGTLAYASPEQTQADRSQIDIRTDVYSLGVILYEVLTGHYPYPVVGQMADVLRNIVEADPQPPSSWHQPLDLRSGDRLPTRRHRIDQDLETIVLKALAKEKDRRYQSAENLRHDLKRYTLGEPIEARQDSAWYVLRKLARRHLYASIILACFAVTLFSATIISIHSYLGKSAALAEQSKNYKVLLERNAQLNDFVEGKHPMIQYRALQGFLACYRTESLARARARMADIPDQTAPEKAVFLFLLNEDHSLDELLTVIPKESAALAYYAAGERHCKAGRYPEAIEAFEMALVSQGDRWTLGCSEDRLQELRRRDVVLTSQQEARDAEAESPPAVTPPE